MPCVSPHVPALLGAAKLSQIDEEGMVDRAYRLHYNDSQRRTDLCSAVGLGVAVDTLGAATAMCSACNRRVRVHMAVAVRQRYLLNVNTAAQPRHLSAFSAYICTNTTHTTQVGSAVGLTAGSLLLRGGPRGALHYLGAAGAGAAAGIVAHVLTRPEEHKSPDKMLHELRSSNS